MEQAYAAYCYGDSTYGQRCLYQLGLTGIPVINVHNNCSSGSSALFLARQAVMSGVVPCALALGFEKMEKGSLGAKYMDRTPAMDKHLGAMIAGRGDWASAPPGPQMFGNAGREHMERYGSTPEHYAWIGWKNHKHSVNNPLRPVPAGVLAAGDQGTPRRSSARSPSCSAPRLLMAPLARSSPPSTSSTSTISGTEPSSSPGRPS
nr:beta-ketoacyl synthase N-terminal-like domain-containing protein [Conexibacter sp. W3-3-2]